MLFDEDGYIVEASNAYFSKPSIINISEDVMNLPTYCEYCKERFNLFNSLVNGVCQSCGRNASLISRNKQQDLSLSSINAKDPNEVSNARVISSFYEYDDFLETDMTTKESAEKTKDQRMQAKTFVEAINLVNKADKKQPTQQIFPNIKTKTTLDSIRKDRETSLFIKPTNKRRGYYEEDDNTSVNG